MVYCFPKIWLSWLPAFHVSTFINSFVSSANTNCYLWQHYISIWPRSLELHISMYNCTVFVAASNATCILQGLWHPQSYWLSLRRCLLWLPEQWTYLKYYVVADIFLSTELIPRKRLKKWINRDGFGTRKILILKWIVLGSVLTWGYKSKLLSTLVTIRYNKPINTLADLDRSGLPLVIAEGSVDHHLFENDQRDLMKQIFNRSIVIIQPTQQNEVKYAAMYETISRVKARCYILSQISVWCKIYVRKVGFP